MSEVKLNIEFGKFTDQENRLFFTFDNTGLDLNKREHHKFMETLGKIVAAQLYAKANNIEPENIKW